MTFLLCFDVFFPEESFALVAGAVVGVVDGVAVGAVLGGGCDDLVFVVGFHEAEFDEFGLVGFFLSGDVVGVDLLGGGPAGAVLDFFVACAA